MRALLRSPRNITLAMLVTCAACACTTAASANINVSPQQEANFQRLVTEVDRIGSPQSARVRDLMIAQHRAMRNHDAASYHKLRLEVAAATAQMTPAQQRHIERVIEDLPVPESPQPGHKTECSVSCANGSCTGTGQCSCIAGNPVCSDMAPALALPGVGALVASLLAASGMAIARRRQ